MAVKSGLVVYSLIALMESESEKVGLGICLFDVINVI